MCIQEEYIEKLSVFIMKIDPYNHKEKYIRWKEKAEQGIFNSEENKQVILQYLLDMERGINISRVSTKGARSYTRLNSLASRMTFFARKFEEHYSINEITKMSEEKIIEFFANMKNGQIKRDDGREFMSVETYTKIFRAFWHWWQKINKKNGIEISDITVDLDTRQEKPKWVYMTEEEIKLLADKAKYDYKILIMFLFDSGIRSPTELINIKVSDLFNDCKELTIRDEISKTFGRRIKLMFSHSLIKEYVAQKGLVSDNYLFPISHHVVNKYLKRLATRVLGDKASPAGAKYSELTMYDFRHCSCCYWLPRYKSESALKYRFGWKKSDKIHYYSELLGMRDTISEEDLLIDVTKTEIEKRLIQTEKENALLQEQVKELQKQFAEIFREIQKREQKMETLR